MARANKVENMVGENETTENVVITPSEIEIIKQESVVIDGELVIKFSMKDGSTRTFGM